jgi:hypothetical protein
MKINTEIIKDKSTELPVHYPEGRFVSQKYGLQVKLWTHICMVLGSNLGSNAGYPGGGPWMFLVPSGKF